MSQSTSRPGQEDLEQQFKLIAADVTELAKLLKKVGEAKAGDAREAALAEANELLERSREKLDDSVKRARGTALSIEDHIREKPVQSALIALGVGFLVGVITRR